MNKEKDSGIPMIFEKDTDGNPGWGVCSLLSKTQVGRSHYMKYDFQLPKADNILNLALGQKVTLCCLNNDDQVAKKDYYLFSPKNTKGKFSILARMDGKEDDGVKLVKGEGDFVSLHKYSFFSSKTKQKKRKKKFDSSYRYFFHLFVSFLVSSSCRRFKRR